MIDKRETGGNSTVMERVGLRRLLERVMNELPLNELCTDASSTIIKLVHCDEILNFSAFIVFLTVDCEIACLLISRFDPDQKQTMLS